MHNGITDDAVFEALPYVRSHTISLATLSPPHPRPRRQAEGHDNHCHNDRCVLQPTHLGCPVTQENQAGAPNEATHHIGRQELRPRHARHARYEWDKGAHPGNPASRDNGEPAVSGVELLSPRDSDLDFGTSAGNIGPTEPHPNCVPHLITDHGCDPHTGRHEPHVGSRSLAHDQPGGEEQSVPGEQETYEEPRLGKDDPPHDEVEHDHRELTQPLFHPSSVHTHAKGVPRSAQGRRWDKDGFMTRIVVIGADAAGASAASGIKRAQPDWDVIMLDRGTYTSYAACGLPYWVAGQISQKSHLIARSPEQHRANGLDVRLKHDVTNIDVDAATVSVTSPDGELTLGYDGLMIATGAAPITPPVSGVHAPNVFAVHTISGVEPLVRAMPATGTRAVIVGAGFIGIEMAEAFLDRGLDVTVVDLADHPMVSLDSDMGALVDDRMGKQGVNGVFGHRLEGIVLDSQGLARAVETDGGTFPCDLVVLALGVRPQVGLAETAGLPLGPGGGIATDDRQQVSDGIYAAGDCVDTYHRLLGHTVVMPLGTHANKQGRVAGINMAGGDATFPGILGTAITKVGHTCIARTGLSQAQSEAAGYNAHSVTSTTPVIAGYMPDPGQMTVKLTADVETGQLLGGQIVGDRALAAKRIDTVATALWNSMSTSDLLNLDLSYAPPFSPVWDPVQIAARRLLSIGRE